MAGNKIRIGADTSEIRKSLLDLSKDVKDLGKSKVAIFDKDEKEYLRAGAKASLENIKKQMAANKKELQEALKVQSKKNKTVVEEYNNRKKIHDIMKKQLDLQKEMQKAQDIQSQVTGGIGGFMGRMRGGIGKGASALGLGGAMRFLGPAGLALGAGAFAYGRGRNAYNTFSEGVDDRLALRGRQVGDMDLDPNLKDRATKAGLNAQSMRRARLASMDVFGKEGSTQSAVLQRAEFERNFGIERGTLSGIGGQLRGNLGGRGAEKATMAVQAGLIASGITDEIGPFLETAANMLTEINEGGISFADSAMAALASVAASGQDVSPERAGRIFSGIDQAIRGSTGEANAFFQQVAGSAGLGGNSILGRQAALRSGGLFGLDVDAMGGIKDVDRKALEQLGIAGTANTGRQMAGGIIGKLDNLFGNEEQLAEMDPDLRARKRLARSNFLMNQLGLSSEAEAMQAEGLLSTIADPTKNADEIEEARKKFEDLSQNQTELGNLKNINKSTAATVEEIRNLKTTVEDEMGGKLAPLFSRIDSAMIKLDLTLSKLLSVFGIETPDEEVEKGINTGELNQDIFDQATMGDPEKQKEFSKQITENIALSQARIDRMEKDGVKPQFGLHGQPIGQYRELVEEKEKRDKLVEATKNIEGLNRVVLGENKQMVMPEDTREKTKKELEYITPKSPEEYVKTLVDNMTSFMKPEPNKEGSTKNIENLLQEQVNQTKNVRKATERGSKVLKNSTGLPAKGGRT